MHSEQERLQQGLDALDSNDCSTALALLLPLAEAGNAQSQAVVGVLFVDSLYRLPLPDDVDGWNNLSQEDIASWAEQDDPEALKWLTRASDQGIGTATHNLSMFVWSHPGALSEEEARAAANALFQKAWEQGCRVFGGIPKHANRY